ncbi:DUF3857 domain-containing protein [Acetobacteroides hydrogenigenes]|uniref:Transglutaminase superfamily protein n=1 Tax=Acetobacteroides hydrogenigenes TaxID=979970 RepID=A0A4R2E800_9BACT|nr:DUF3857 domain-containing protein [Acetobacteroides hydrogenigenes]TCN63875.1 transglutaminase superfamily protein [Acetobacteroides hydrogenigenes]
MNISPYLPLLLLLSLWGSRAQCQPHNAEVVKYNSICVVEAGKFSQIDTIIIQINNRIGEDYTHVAIPYSKTYKISDIDAWITNSAGNRIRSLKSSDITTRSAISNISLYEDDFVKEFQLKHNVYPYQIAYTYKATCKDYIDFTRWTPIIDNRVPTRAAHLTMVVPKNLPMKKYAYNVVHSKVDTTSNGVILQWDACYPNVLKSEIYAKPLDSYFPFVAATPLHFSYGVEGCTHSWQSFGEWQNQLQKGLEVLPEKEKNHIKQLTEGVTDKKEIVKILYHYLQDNTRYINVSIGIGGMKPYPASYVAQNKYGDCKALSNYMRAILRCAGIDSHYVLVNAGNQPSDLIRDFVSSQFNHAIVAVPLEKDTLWLETTSNINPFGYMGTFTQNREALLISENASRIVKIPSLQDSDSFTSRRMKFDLQTDGNASTAISFSFRGRDFELFNQLNSELNTDEQDKIIREYMHFSNYEVKEWLLKKPHRDTARIELHSTLNLYKILKPLAGDYYFGLYPSRIPAFVPVNARKLPVNIPYPICNSDTLIYTIPQGYKVTSNLNGISLKSRFGSYELAFTYSKGELLVAKKVILKPAHYQLEEYPELYRFIQEIKEAEKRAIVLKPEA